MERARETSQRRLERVASQVSDLWFPVDPVLLAKIREQAKDTSAVHIGDLVREISKDFSLFAYCLKELSSMLEEIEEDVPYFTGASELFEYAGIERLQVVLNQHPNHISRHSFHGITTHQVSRFQEMMISVSTSQTLAERYAVDPSLAYSAALFRQLGYTLIAWNYPAVYEAAVLECAKGKSLDDEIMQRLGVSPMLLALRLASTWRLAPELYEELLQPAEALPSFEGEAEAISGTLIKIAEVGEALARANSPQNYPTARDDWIYASRELEESLGKEALKKIQSQMYEYSGHFETMMPHIFRGAMVLDPVGHQALLRQRTAIDRNPFLSNCRQYLQERLLDWYLRHEPDDVSSTLLAELAKKIIPYAGFQRGCVYGVDPASQSLVPQLEIGTASTRDFRTILYSSSENSKDLILNAFHGSDVIIEELRESVTNSCVRMACPLGIAQRIGVVYLELPTSVFAADQSQQIIHFKALVQSFNDALGI